MSAFRPTDSLPRYSADSAHSPPLQSYFFLLSSSRSQRHLTLQTRAHARAQKPLATKRRRFGHARHCRHRRRRRRDRRAAIEAVARCFLTCARARAHADRRPPSRLQSSRICSNDQASLHRSRGATAMWTRAVPLVLHARAHIPPINRSRAHFTR